MGVHVGGRIRKVRLVIEDPVRHQLVSRAYDTRERAVVSGNLTPTAGQLTMSPVTVVKLLSAEGGSRSAGQEVDHPCVSQMLGSNPNPMNFGNSSWGTVGNNGGWNIRSWSGFVNSCPSDYERSISGDIITIWDSRNTS